MYFILTQHGIKLNTNEHAPKPSGSAHQMVSVYVKIGIREHVMANKMNAKIDVTCEAIRNGSCRPYGLIFCKQIFVSGNIGVMM